MRISHSTTATLLARVIAGVALFFGVLFGLKHPALAKGPESVTILGPRIDQPLELMDGTNYDQVARLMEQTGLWFGTGDLPRSIPGPPEQLGPRYILTWVNSGPPGLSVEARTIYQEIYLDAEGGPVIHTPDQETLDNWGPGVIGWFSAPEGLRDTLTGLGVPIASGPSWTIISAAFSALGSAGTIRYLSIAGLVLLIVLAGVLRARRMVQSP